MARSQPRRLDEYNAIAQRNAAILTEGLGSIPGLVPPHVPADRTSVYHKYRIRLDAQAAGYTGPITELRDQVLFALRAEGVEAVVWQLDALPAYPAFRRGQLRPWHPRDDKQPLESWDRGAFPETAALLDCSIVIGSMQYPIYIQDASLMERYVEAAAKVMADLGAVLAAPRPGSEG
jgi:perosamine synthetase